MHRSYALALGATAMALVACRGAVQNGYVSTVAVDSVVALVVFSLLGGIVGAIADHLVRTNLELDYRRRVAWYREERERRAAIKK